VGNKARLDITPAVTAKSPRGADAQAIRRLSDAGKPRKVKRRRLPQSRGPLFYKSRMMAAHAFFAGGFITCAGD